MAGPEPRVPYNPTQEVAPEVGSPSNSLRVQANPQAFGSQVGQATQNLGKTEEDLANPLINYALKRQGQINEAAAVNGETQANDAWGQITRKFKANKGFAADAALPEAEEQARQVRQKIRETMPNDAAAKAFDMMVARSEGFVIRDMYNHSDTERNQGHAAVLTANRKMWQERSGRPEIAFPGVDGNEDAWNENKANMISSASHELNNMIYGSDAGITKTDPDSGQPIFSDDQHGKDQKTIYDNYINQITGDAWKQRFDTILHDPDQGSATIAHNLYEQHRSEIPGNVIGDIAKMIAPQYNNQQTRAIADKYTGAGGLVDQEYKAYNDNLTNQFQGDTQPGVASKAVMEAFRTEETGSDRTNPNQFQIQGATWQQWAKPGEDLEKDNETVATRMIQKYLDDYHSDLARAAVAYTAGPGNVNKNLTDTTPWSDPDPIIEGPHGVRKHYSEWNSGKTLGKYVDDIVGKTQGISMGGGPQLNYEDYLQLNYGKVLERIDDDSQTQFPGRPDLAAQSVSRGSQNLLQRLRSEHLLNSNVLNTVDQFVTDMDGKGTALTTQYQFELASPEIKDAWHRMQTQFPVRAKAYADKFATQNLAGKATDYGSSLYKNFQDVVNGKTQNILDLSNDMDGIKLTNTGYTALKRIMDQNNTSEGKSFNTSMSDFFKQVHNQLVIRSVAGVVDTKGETRFNEFMQAALPEIEAKQKKNLTAGEMFTPDSKSYIGNTIHLYDRSLAQKTIDFKQARENSPYQRFVNGSTSAIKFDVKSLDGLDKTKGIALLNQWFNSKQITGPQATQFAIDHGWKSKPTSGVPTADRTQGR